METSDREKRDRIYAHAFAQVWLDDFRKAASRGAPQVPYDELVEKALELVSDIRQTALGELDELPPEEREAAAKYLDDCGLGWGLLRLPFPF